MKRFLGILGIAIIGGAISLTGYKFLVEQPVKVVEKEEPVFRTFQTNYNPGENKNKTNDAIANPVSFTNAAEKTVNAVVHVKNTAVQSGVNSLADLFYGRGSRQQVGTGSGVIISPDGYIVTNNHVIANAAELEITLNNRKKYKAELIGTDEKNDIALLKIEANERLSHITFANSNNIKVGEWVLAVGNPYNLTSTVTAGIVSAKGRDLQGNGNITDSFIQTDAAVNPGNSGGALVNTRGELVGINTAITSKTGSYIGYSFAVPSNIARKIVDDLLEFGSVQEAIIGFSPIVKDDVEGVEIGSFGEDSNAEKAGLRTGDIIVKINNEKITKFSDLTGQLTAKRPGQNVDVTVKRNGKYLTRSVKLIKRKLRFISSQFQIEFGDLTKKDKKNFGVKSGAKIIRENFTNSESSTLVGYVITKVNNKNISSASEASKLLDKLAQSGYRVKVEMISPDGERGYYYFR